MDNTPKTSYSASAPSAAGGAGAPEIEITPEMLRAGVNAFHDWDPEAEEIEALAASVFFRMMRAAVIRQR
jgi:hypothetical protein